MNTDKSSPVVEGAVKDEPCTFYEDETHRATCNCGHILVGTRPLPAIGDAERMRLACVEFNLNDQVVVELAPLGKQIWVDYWSRYTPAPNAMTVKADEQFLTIQLHALANIFGPSLMMGGTLPMSTSIRFASPPVLPERAATGDAEDQDQKSVNGKL